MQIIGVSAIRLVMASLLVETTKVKKTMRWSVGRLKCNRRFPAGMTNKKRKNKAKLHFTMHGSELRWSELRTKIAARALE